MKDEQLESMCRSLFDILQRSLRVAGDETEEKKKERVSNYRDQKRQRQEEVKKQEEMEGKIEGRKKKDKNSYVKLGSSRVQPKSWGLHIISVLYLLFYNKVISIRGVTGLHPSAQTDHKQKLQRDPFPSHFNTFLLEKHCPISKSTLQILNLSTEE